MAFDYWDFQKSPVLYRSRARDLIKKRPRDWRMLRCRTEYRRHIDVSSGRMSDVVRTSSGIHGSASWRRHSITDCINLIGSTSYYWSNLQLLVDFFDNHSHCTVFREELSSLYLTSTPVWWPGIGHWTSRVRVAEIPSERCASGRTWHLIIAGYRTWRFRIGPRDGIDDSSRGTSYCTLAGICNDGFFESCGGCPILRIRNGPIDAFC